MITDACCKCSYLMPKAKRVLDPGAFTLYLLFFFSFSPSQLAIPFPRFFAIQKWTSTQASVAYNCHQCHT